MTTKAKKGDWVQIEQTILEPHERAPQVPEDTKQVPLKMWVKGFLAKDAEVGEEATITTVIGRKHTGKLVAISPRYKHDFGGPIPELLPVGPTARAMLKRGG